MPVDERNRFERRLQAREVQHRQHAASGHGIELHGDVQDHGQRAFRSRDELREVERPSLRELVEVVAAHPPHHLRVARADLVLVLAHEPAYGPVDLSLEIVLRADRVQLGVVQLAQAHHAAVAQHDGHGDRLVDRLAVLDRARARRVVRDHAADRGAVRRAHVGRELQAVRGHGVVQRVSDHARLHRRGAGPFVHLENPGQVLAHVDHDGASHRLARQARAAAPGKNRSVVPCAHAHAGHHVVAVERDNDAERRDLVRARVGRVQRPRPIVEAHLAADLGAQVAFEGRQGGVVEGGRGIPGRPAGRGHGGQYGTAVRRRIGRPGLQGSA